MMRVKHNPTAPYTPRILYISIIDQHPLSLSYASRLGKEQHSRDCPTTAKQQISVKYRRVNETLIGNVLSRRCESDFQFGRYV